MLGLYTSIYAGYITEQLC